MPRHEPDLIREAIWAAMGEMRTAEILRALENDELGLGRSIKLSRRTLQRRMEELKKERGDPPTNVAPGEEMEAAQVIQRTFLGVVSRRLREAASGTSKPEALNKLAPAMRIVNEIAKPASQATSQSRAGKKGSRAKVKGTALEKIGQELAREPASPDPQGGEVNGTSRVSSAEAESEDEKAGDVHADMDMRHEPAESSPLHSSG